MIRLSTGNWELKNMEAVIFDKDGTFINLHKFWGKITELRALEIIKSFNLTKDSFNEICLFLGYNYESKKMISNGITAMYSRSEIIKILKEKLEQSYNIQISTNKITSIFDMISEHFYKNMFEYTETIESAINFIKKLYNKNIKLGIVTSDSIISTKKTLKYFNLEYLFDVIVGRETSQETKESGIPTKMAQLIAKLDASGILEPFSKGKLPTLKLLRFRDTASDQMAIAKGIKEFDINNYTIN